jgi:hypothetical protein
VISESDFKWVTSTENGLLNTETVISYFYQKSQTMKRKFILYMLDASVKQKRQKVIIF